MKTELVSIGFDNYLAVDRVVGISSLPKSAPTIRAIQDSRDLGLLIDVTHGRKPKSVIFTDSSHIILSAFNPRTIVGRYLGQAGEEVSSGS